MLHSNKLLQSLLAVTLLLHVAICIAAVPYSYRMLSYSVLGKPTHSYKVSASFPTKHKWLKSRIQYYSNNTASYNLTTTAILACGDVHPNPGPALSSSRKQVGAKLNSLRAALYLNARSLMATAESLDDRAKKTSKLTILQNLVYLEQYDIVCVSETWLNELILDNEILPGYTIHRKDRHGNMRGGGVLAAVRN